MREGLPRFFCRGCNFQLLWLAGKPLGASYFQIISLPQHRITLVCLFQQYREISSLTSLQFVHFRFQQYREISSPTSLQFVYFSSTERLQISLRVAEIGALQPELVFTTLLRDCTMIKYNYSKVLQGHYPHIYGDCHSLSSCQSQKRTTLTSERVLWHPVAQEQPSCFRRRL